MSKNKGAIPIKKEEPKTVPTVPNEDQKQVDPLADTVDPKVQTELETIPPVTNEDQKDNTQKGIEISVPKHRALTPILHNGKTYPVDEDVTDIFDDETLAKLKTIGAVGEDD